MRVLIAGPRDGSPIWRALQRSRGHQVGSIKKAFQAASERSKIQDGATTEEHYAQYSPGYLRKVAAAIQRRVKPRHEVQSEPSTVHID